MKLYLQNIVENIYLEILPANWLGIEMGEHLYSVLLPRMKKAFACDKSGISKELKTPHFFGDPSTRGELVRVSDQWSVVGSSFSTPF